ncbi:hypothetical protein AB0I28_12100 [Phytomonospora sp. NPDC050363]|uniref:hypothetical protein n=1 Tax=Phytomonospora sp. NPDC050363 TaxID=3155642 RepID=UPI0033D393B8
MRRLFPVVPATVLAAAFALGGCGLGQDCDPEPPGVAGVSVGVTRGEGNDEHLVAEVTDWRLAPHPQVPDEGDRVFFHLSLTPVSGYYVVDERIELQVCGIDAQRVVLSCTDVTVEVAGDGSATVAEGDLSSTNAAATDQVVVLSNRIDGSGHSCADPKDFDGYTPPRFLSPGERV